MQKYKWYRWTWADGTVIISRKLNEMERLAMERKHGKLVVKKLEGVY